MNKLKPCPFCGGEAILKNYGRGTGGYMISCKNWTRKRCGVLMTAYAQKAHDAKGIHKEIKQEVIQAWNRRTKDEQP